MENPTQETQESRTAKATFALTPREKLAIQFLAGARDTDLSNLIHERVVMVLIPEAEEVRAKLRGEP